MDIIRIIMIVSVVLFLGIVIAYFILNKRMKRQLGDIQNLRIKDPKQKKSSDIKYQKLYLLYKKLPFINRYMNKIRRRLEIINLQDEYKTRIQTAKVLTRGLIIVAILTIIIVAITKSNTFLMWVLLIFEIVIVESFISGMVDKMDTKLLRQQIDFFSEVRHAYHEYNMVEEAIYAAAQEDDETEIAHQAEKVYEILTSDDPETELEKYYDIAPNSYLKEFAGVSYLTKEFGDRQVDGASLYLKNLNNITQEMQLEILKRDKLDYVFQSLSIISALPVLLIEPIKNWAISSFAFTSSFYNGKAGLIVQVLLLILTLVCYILIRKVKDNGSIKDAYKDVNKTWQVKAYKHYLVKKFVDLFVPKRGTKSYRKNIDLLKQAASKQKIESLYINRLVTFIATLIVSFVFCLQMHNIAISYVYEQPTTDYNIIGGMSEQDNAKAMALTAADNVYIDKYKNNSKVTVDMIKQDLKDDKDYKETADKDLQTVAQRIYDKVLVVNKEYLQWFEILLSFAFAAISYYVPIWLLVFQKIMRKLEMEDEVMQYQTIIMMLMKIERVNVEMILEWLERYSNIFREPISKCVNNYEAGAWEALDELKNDISFPQLIRIVESLQAAVEKIPIAEAFDELDTERAYYQEKRKESNERLVSKKGLIGKGIGFAPMVLLFIGYLIVPLVFIGLTSMMSGFNSMSAMAKQ
ncbi:MAG: hypothetical protein LBL91_05260 [Lachnospiraceae bacterium]|nr:hypothetical protein [Lachnospiraceae bacterium]